MRARKALIAVYAISVLATPETLLAQNQPRVHVHEIDIDNTKKYDEWIKEAVSHSEQNNTVTAVVHKKQRILEVYQNGQLKKSYKINLGKGCEDARNKESKDDTCTPEGIFTVIDRRERDRTSYYKELLLDYPRQEDFERGIASGQITWRDLMRDLYVKLRDGRPATGTPLGGPIGIHGYGGTGSDWTEGYIALSNEAMDELFNQFNVGRGTKVAIVRD